MGALRLWGHSVVTWPCIWMQLLLPSACMIAPAPVNTVQVDLDMHYWGLVSVSVLVWLCLRGFSNRGSVGWFLGKWEGVEARKEWV